MSAHGYHLCSPRKSGKSAHPESPRSSWNAAMRPGNTVYIRPTSQKNQTLLFTNFKMKTIKNFLGRTIQIPARIRHALHRFTTHVPLPAQTVSEPSSSPTTRLQVLCLNTQVTVQSKIRALHAIIKKTGFPAALMLQEVGKIPDDFVFHPLYANCTPNRNSTGACILLRRIQQIVVLVVHFEPNYRVVVVRATISLKKVQMINVYLKTGGEPHELRVTLEWIVPFLLDTELFTIYGGDFQANPGRDTSCPLASTAINTASLDTFTDTSLQVVPKEQDVPTWVAPQWGTGSLLIHEPPKYNGTLRVQATSSFPSDHTPILLCIPNFTPINPPISTATHWPHYQSKGVITCYEESISNNI